MFSLFDKFTTSSTVGSMGIAIVGTTVVLATLVVAHLDLDDHEDAIFIFDSLGEQFDHKYDDDLTGEVPFLI